MVDRRRLRVATLSKVTDPPAATHYYEADDYYTRDAKVPSRWHGMGAQALGVDGDVEPDTFAAMLKGQLPIGASLGTRHGRTVHKLGWGLTFSASKSVSVIGLVAGDRRLLDAHDRAVMVPLDYAERHVSVARIREGKSIEPVLAGNLTVATFPHFTARATEGQQPNPQLHTHSVILKRPAPPDPSSAAHQQSSDDHGTAHAAPDGGACQQLHMGVEGAIAAPTDVLQRTTRKPLIQQDILIPPKPYHNVTHNLSSPSHCYRSIMSCTLVPRVCAIIRPLAPSIGPAQFPARSRREPVSAG